MVLKYKSILALVETLNGDDIGSKLVSMSYLADIRLYTATTGGSIVSLNRKETL